MNVKAPKRMSFPALVSVATVALWLAACTARPAQRQGAGGVAHLTPIPEATVRAYRPGTPVDDELDAVIAARAYLETSRLRFSAPPVVRSAEELTVAEANQRLNPSSTDDRQARAGDPRVWLVEFEGDWQVIPPDPLHTVTPEPPQPGCVQVLIDGADGSGTSVRGMECLP